MKNDWAIKSVVDRSDPEEFGCAVYETVPFPKPETPAVIDAQVGALLSAVHAQFAHAVTVTLPLPPVAATVAAPGLIAPVHGADCVRLNVCPAITSVVDRSQPVTFGCAVYETVPFPKPEAPAVIDAHVALLSAVHAQFDTAVTVTLPLPFVAAIVAASGVIAPVHEADCVRLNVCPAIKSADDRSDVVGLLVTENVTIALPDPDGADVTVSQPVAALTVQSHWDWVQIVSVPMPAVPGSAKDGGERA